MSEQDATERWTSGDLYEPCIGRWSRPVAREFLAWLDAPAGLARVATRAIDVPTVFRDLDDHWTPFLGGQGPTPGYCMALAEDARAALRDRVRQALPAHPDGSIHLTARAWAVRGRKT
jgi:hypothetical protein